MSYMNIPDYSIETGKFFNRQTCTQKLGEAQESQSSGTLHEITEDIQSPDYSEYTRKI